MDKKLIKATDIFQTSVDFIDEDHGEQADLIERLRLRIKKYSKQNTAYSEINKELEDLITHFQEHFSHEEELMEKINYPAISIHVNDHDVMLTGLKNVYVDFAESKDIDKLEYFVQEILLMDFLDHIMLQDSITADYYLITQSNSQ